jgi:hypothetical protein
MYMLVRIGARVAIWAITIAVAFFPALTSGDAPISLNPFEIAGAVNEKGHFSEFYFGGMVISVFSLSNLWDSIITRALWQTIPVKATKVWKATVGLTVLVFPFFLIVVVYGMARYIRINGIILSQEEVTRDVRLLMLMVIVSISTEAMIGLSESIRTD